MGFSAWNDHLIWAERVTSITAHYAGTAAASSSDAAWRAALSSLSSPGPPLGRVGRDRGLPIVLEQQPNVAGALVIDGAWKLVPEFN